MNAKRRLDDSASVYELATEKKLKQDEAATIVQRDTAEYSLVKASQRESQQLKLVIVIQLGEAGSAGICCERRAAQSRQLHHQELEECRRQLQSRGVLP